MKCSFILIILLFPFHVIGGGKFRRHIIEKMCQFAYIVPNKLKRILQPQVKLTEASPTIMENCIQGRNLNKVKWLCLKKCMIRQLPSNLFSCLQLRVLDLAQCQSLENIPSYIGQLKALQEFDLVGCGSLQKLPTSIGQLNALQVLHLSCCSKLKELPSSIGQLNALQKLDLNGCFQLK